MKRGTLKIPAIFDSARAFSEGLAWVQRGKLFGYIDKDGFMAIEAKADSPGVDYSSQTFSEGVAPLSDHGKVGFINRSGEWVISPRYKTASEFHDGLAVADGAYIDHTGKAVTEKYNRADAFSEGLAHVVRNDGTQAVIDVKGKVQFTLPKQIAGMMPFSDGMAVFTVQASQNGTVQRLLGPLRGYRDPASFRNRGSVP